MIIIVVLNLRIVYNLLDYIIIMQKNNIFVVIQSSLLHCRKINTGSVLYEFYLVIFI